MYQEIKPIFYKTYMIVFNIGWQISKPAPKDITLLPFYTAHHFTSMILPHLFWLTIAFLYAIVIFDIENIFTNWIFTLYI